MNFKLIFLLKKIKGMQKLASPVVWLLFFYFKGHICYGGTFRRMRMNISFLLSGVKKSQRVRLAWVKMNIIFVNCKYLFSNNLEYVYFKSHNFYDNPLGYTIL